jgi:hypothetical protein
VVKSEVKRRLRGVRVPGVYPLVRGAYGLSRSLRRAIVRRSAGARPYTLIQSSERRHILCGYYGASPFSPSNAELLLVQSTDASLYRAPDPTQRMHVSVIEWRTGRSVAELGFTSAWNWQQGCRALWLPDGRCVYNVYDDRSRRYSARIVDVEAGTAYEVPFPVQEVASTGELYSISYAALAATRRDYGYFCRPVVEADLRDAGLVSFSANSTTSAELVACRDLKEDAEGRHASRLHSYRINHVLANPSGNKLVFLFRYSTDVVERTISDVIVYDLQRKSWDVVWEDSGVSHYTWMDDESLLLTGVHRGQFGYCTLSLGVGRVEMVRRMTDGHPVWLAPPKFITDSYPDQFGVRHLWLASVDGSEWESLGEFVEPWYLWGERRCDLHPSVSGDRRYWQVDMVAAGRRSIAIGEL